MKKIFLASVIGLIINPVYAGEIQVMIENKSNYPIKLHYQLYSGKNIFLTGKIKNLAANDKFTLDRHDLPEPPMVVKLYNIKVNKFNAPPCLFELDKDHRVAEFQLIYTQDELTPFECKADIGLPDLSQ